MPGILTISVALLLLIASTSVILLARDVSAGRLRQRVVGVRRRPKDPTSDTPARVLALRSRATRSERVAQFMRFLRFNPDIPQQNIIAWKLVCAIAGVIAILGFFYSRAFLGTSLAVLIAPLEGVLVARVIFGWERARFQKALLEQIPEVMALICRAVGAGIPLSEALRSVARDVPNPSRDEFVRVINEVMIGHSLEHALWKLHARVGLPEYAFFAVTIGLQSQTGGSLIETLQNLQDIVRKRVALSKRGKALAAEARFSALILGSLPFVMSLVLSFIRPGFVDFFLNTPSGNSMLLIAIGLMAMGILVMRQLIRRSLAP
jgi:tight adherence protein B